MGQGKGPKVRDRGGTEDVQRPCGEEGQGSTRGPGQLRRAADERARVRKERLGRKAEHIKKCFLSHREGFGLIWIF